MSHSRSAPTWSSRPPNWPGASTQPAGPEASTPIGPPAGQNSPSTLAPAHRYRRISAPACWATWGGEPATESSPWRWTRAAHSGGTGRLHANGWSASFKTPAASPGAAGRPDRRPAPEDDAGTPSAAAARPNASGDAPNPTDSGQVGRPQPDPLPVRTAGGKGLRGRVIRPWKGWRASGLPRDRGRGNP